MSNSYTAQDFITAIPGTGGIISAIARKVGCEWNTAKKWIDTAPTVKRAYDAECEAMLDLAESAVLRNIKLAAHRATLQRLADWAQVVELRYGVTP